VQVARASGDGSSAIPGHDATTAKVSAGALGAKPGYLRNPHPAYPEEARAAGQQGVVTLYVRVDEQGRVASVRVSRSSGFSILDERARSTVANQWAFKPAKAGGIPIASDVIIPIRFTLDR
jgi:protein TonB